MRMHLTNGPAWFPVARMVTLARSQVMRGRYADTSMMDVARSQRRCGRWTRETDDAESVMLRLQGSDERWLHDF